MESIFKDKKMAVVGFGSEGKSAADFLVKKGAKVEVFDAKSEEDFSADVLISLRDLGVVFNFGKLGPFDGFDFIVRSPGISPRLPELEEAKKRGIIFTSATKIFFDLCPCPIIGVTGTKGKGTTCSLVHETLLASGKDSYICGNIGTPALDILDKLKKDSIVVYELSSFQLIELEKSPLIAVVLMITSDHLDFHVDERDYVLSKANIVKFQNSGDKAIINIDYPSSKEMIGMTRADVFLVSRAANLEQKIQNGAYVEGDSIMLSVNGSARKVMDIHEVSLAGAHNLENVCAAAMTCSLLGISDEVISNTTKSFKALPHRLEFIREVNGVKYYDDSISTTPESAMAALAAFAGPKLIILGGSSKGADWRGLAAAASADRSLKVIFGIGEEWPKIKEAILKANTSENKIEMVDVASMQEIILKASSMALPGDSVILSPGCASFDMFKNYKDRGEKFSSAVREL